MGRMGRTQPRGIAGHHGTTAALIFRVSPACVSATLPDQPSKSDTASPEKAHARPKGFAGPFHTKLWRALDFGGYVP